MTLTVTGMPSFDHFALELQAIEAAGLLPGVRVAPAEQLPITAVQVVELFWPH